MEVTKQLKKSSILDKTQGCLKSLRGVFGHVLRCKFFTRVSTLLSLRMVKHWFVAQTAEVAHACLKTVDDIVSTLISLKVPGHRAIELSTQDLSMKLKKDYVDNLSGATFHLRSATTDKGGRREGEVRLPDIMGNSDTSAEHVICMQVDWADHV